MDASEMLEDIRSWYETAVKPNIQQGNLLEARIQMSNLYVTLTGYARQFEPYASATLFVASAHALEEALISNAPLDTPTEQFDAYLAQICLAVKSGNKSNV